MFTGQVRKGKLILDRRAAFDAFIAAQQDGQALRVIVKRPSRSRSANAYYWGVVVPTIADATDNDNEATHEALKSMFLGRRVMDLGKREVVTTRSSAGLDSKEFAEYVDRCIAFAATELNTQIPPAGMGCQ